GRNLFLIGPSRHVIKMVFCLLPPEKVAAERKRQRFIRTEPNIRLEVYQVRGAHIISLTFKPACRIWRLEGTQFTIASIAVTASYIYVNSNCGAYLWE